MKKVSILALHLGYGGIEKCISSLANALVNDYEVEILCTYKLYDEPVYEIDKKVKIKYLTDVMPNKNEFKLAVKHKNIIKILKEGIKALNVLYHKKYANIKAIKNCHSDIIISTRDYFNYLVGKYAKQEKIGWEHNHHHNDKKYINNLTKSCRHLDKLILVSNNLKDYYTKLFEDKKINCQCIYIPNFLDQIPELSSKLKNNNLLSVGRLSKEKGMADLIDVYKLVDLKVNDTHLNIIGDGVEKENIEKKILKDNLALKVELHGFQDKDYINRFYLDSSLYLMTSKTESFGLVLVEAMSYGLPCIAYDSAEGANDIIQNNYNGYLIKNRNEHDMADKIIELLNNRKELQRLGNNAKKTALKYSQKEVLEEWKKVL